MRKILARMLLGCMLLAAGGAISLSVAARTSGTPAADAASEFQTGKFRQAADALEHARENGRLDAASELLLARCYYEMGDWDRAAADAESAIQIDPKNAEGHLWLGRAYGHQAQRDHSFSLALKTRHEFEKAVELAPGNVDARRDLMQFYLNAPWIVGGSKDKAKKQMDAIASISPVQGVLAHARFDESTGREAAAAGEYQRVLSMNPTMAGPYLEAADFYIKRKDVAGLNAALQGAEKINPADGRLDYYRGVARVLEGQRLEQGEKDLRAYVAHAPRRDDPSKADALSWLGQLYERWGKSHLAVIEYEAALQLDPGIPLARQALARLNHN